MELQITIPDSGQLDANPASGSVIRWREEDLRGFADKTGLEARRRGKPDGNVTVVMVIVGEHGEHFVVYKERRMSVGEAFFRFRKGCTNPTYALKLFPANNRAWLHEQGPLPAASGPRRGARRNTGIFDPLKRRA